MDHHGPEAVLCRVDEDAAVVGDDGRTVRHYPWSADTRLPVVRASRHRDRRESAHRRRTPGRDQGAAPSATASIPTGGGAVSEAAVVLEGRPERRVCGPPPPPTCGGSSRRSSAPTKRPAVTGTAISVEQLDLCPPTEVTDLSACWFPSVQPTTPFRKGSTSPASPSASPCWPLPWRSSATPPAHRPDQPHRRLAVGAWDFAACVRPLADTSWVRRLVPWVRR